MIRGLWVQRALRRGPHLIQICRVVRQHFIEAVVAAGRAGRPVLEVYESERQGVLEGHAEVIMGVVLHAADVAPEAEKGRGALLARGGGEAPP